MFIINALITFSVLMAVITAISGRTRRRADGPILRRITLRGWVSLSLMVFAFVLGAYKESVYKQQISQHKTIAQKLSAELDELKDKSQYPQGNNKRKSTEFPVADNPVTVSNKASRKKGGSDKAASIPEPEIIESTGDWDIILNGDALQKITSSESGPMQILPGTSFHFVIFGSEYSEQQLSSLKMEVGNREFQLLSDKSSSQEDFLVDGSGTQAMQAYIKNPLGLRNVRIRIFLRPSNDKQVAKQIRNVISSKAKQTGGGKYTHQITTDGLRLRAIPGTGSRVLVLLRQGARIKLLQTRDNWSQVLTPDGVQGWVASQYLAISN